MADPDARPAEAPALDELMMAMDVVDTLRHEERLVARELGQDDRDAELKRRLRALYEGQGLEVTERILDEGIAALRESRFAYEPPPPSWRVTLARLWVSRWRWGPWAGGAAALLVLWLGWTLAAPAPETRVARLVSERAAAAEALAATEPARAAVDEARRMAEAALAAGRLQEAEAAATRLAALADELALAFELRIVSRPGEPTGVFRIPDANEAARNHYIVVEALGPDGRPLSRPVTSEETGETRTVTKWGVRVPKATFDRVARDKQDDGIVQDAVLGRKPAGRLAIEWAMPVSDGAITEW